MFRFLETDIRQQKGHEKRIQTYVDNKVDNLRFETKFENRMKDQTNFFIKWNIAFFLNKNLFYNKRVTLF